MPLASKIPSITLPKIKSKGKSTFAKTLCLFYGAPGVGKTRFANELDDKVFFISTDRGTRYLNTYSQDCNDYETLCSIMEQLKKNPKLYNFICLDHIDDITTIIENYVCRSMKIDHLSDGEYGKPWDKAAAMTKKLVQDILNLNLGLIILAHEKTKKITIHSGEFNILAPSITERSGKIVIPMCEIVGYISKQKERDPKDKTRFIERRILTTQNTETLYAKDRTDRLKPEGRFEYLDPKAFVASFSHQKV